MLYLRFNITLKQYVVKYTVQCDVAHRNSARNFMRVSQ